MKKVLSLLLALVMVFCFASCGKKAETVEFKVSDLEGNVVYDFSVDYKDGATVKVHALNETLPENGLYSNAMAGSDRMELYLTVNAAGDQMMLVSLFDNLGKGSSGAAIQCMNLMLGLDEVAGLE